MPDADTEEFEAFSTADSAPSRPEFEGTNAVRFALVSLLGEGTNQAGSGLRGTGLLGEASFAKFGLNNELLELPASLEGWASREVSALLSRNDEGWTADEARVSAWRDLNENRDPTARIELLVAGLGSALERESVVAAVAIATSSPFDAAALPPPEWFARMRLSSEEEIWRIGRVPMWQESDVDGNGESHATLAWSGQEWSRFVRRHVRRALKSGQESVVVAVIAFLARYRVETGLLSTDQISRQIATSSYFTRSLATDRAQARGGAAVTKATGLVSTMVHGTWGWKGDWWYPGGDFHTYIQSGIRSTLYQGGQEYSWSGAYRENQRAIGGERFKRWVQASGNQAGLKTVFAHSYGGEIVARAVNAGAAIDEVVLLSAPIHRHHEAMLDRVNRVVDVRLRHDIVLLLARARQSLPDHDRLTTHFVDRNFWSHGATHQPEVWRSEDIARGMGL